jgi:hypothetical protein
VETVAGGQHGERVVLDHRRSQGRQSSSPVHHFLKHALDEIPLDEITQFINPGGSGSEVKKLQLRLTFKTNIFSKTYLKY